MREKLAAPIVPGTRPQDWVVFYAGDEPLQGPHNYAFTNRATLERWAATREDGWRWLALSEVPSRAVLVLDEAWSLKYAEPVPEMCSAEDGRRVLEMLLRGKATITQKWFGTRESFLQEVRGGAIADGVSVLCGLSLLRDWHETYVALDPKNWAPNGEIATEGELVARWLPREYQVFSPTGVVATGRGRRLTWHDEYVGPVMVIGGCHTYDTWQWNPEPSKAELPLYLRLLA